MKPTKGRIVLYKNHDNDDVGIIVHVCDDETVNLVAWNAGGNGNGVPQVHLQVKQGGDVGCWDWPPRV